MKTISQGVCLNKKMNVLTVASCAFHRGQNLPNNKYANCINFLYSTGDTLAITENQIICRSYFAFVTYTAVLCVVTQRSFQRTAAENRTTFLSVHSANPTSASMMRAKFTVRWLLQSQPCFYGCPTWDWQEENQETTLALEDTLDLASSLQSSKFLWWYMQ